nr:DUF3291 domain-containing protein [uncultured Hyphomonas sp.]
MGYRLIHFNCARPLGAFSLDNEFIRVFVSIMPRVFADAAAFEGLHFHRHGVRRPDGVWMPLHGIFPYPEGLGAPDVSTMGGWTSLEHLKEFAYSGRTHPPSMRRLAMEIDRSTGPSFVMWWAPKGEKVSMEDGWQKLQHLRQHGSTPEAFSLDDPIDRPIAA